MRDTTNATNTQDTATDTTETAKITKTSDKANKVGMHAMEMTNARKNMDEMKAIDDVDELGEARANNVLVSRSENTDVDRGGTTFAPDPAGGIPESLACNGTDTELEHRFSATEDGVEVAQ